MSVVTRCAANETVKVAAMPYSDVTPYSVYSARKTSFTGFKIGTDDVNCFSAHLADDENIFAGQTITFGTVATNVGGFYFPNQGNFLCPDNDQYMFTWGVEADINTRAKAGLMFGGSQVVLGPVTSMTAEPVPTSRSATTSVTNQCQQGTAVWIEAKDNPPFPHNSLKALTTSFNGYKISDSPVAFTATLSVPQSVVEGDAVVYDNVVSNLGNSYDPNTGAFLCPSDGAYMFTWSVHVNITRASFQLKID